MENEIKDIIEILELSKEEIENNDENVTATLDLEDLKALKKLYDLYKEADKERDGIYDDYQDLGKENLKLQEELEQEKNKINTIKKLMSIGDITDEALFTLVQTTMAELGRLEDEEEIDIQELEDVNLFDNGQNFNDMPIIIKSYDDNFTNINNTINKLVKSVKQLDKKINKEE